MALTSKPSRGNVSMVAATPTRNDLLTLSPDRILHRLFWEQAVHRFEPQVPRFICSNSRERVSGLLRKRCREKSDGVTVERGPVEVVCAFCGQHQCLDAVGVGVGEMLTPARLRPKTTQPAASEPRPSAALARVAFSAHVGAGQRR